MNLNFDASAEKLKFLILNSTQPLVFKKAINSDLLNWGLKDWNAILKDELLEFRCGINAHTREPQWETRTETRKLKFEDFIKFTETDQTEWMYFDYKYLKDWFVTIDELRNNISWEAFGFPNLDVDHSTIWIGSKGAHTPCHVDTYGCNIVLQVFGRKQWLVFPPEQNLKPTRIPYEESTIFSKLNFFSPDLKKMKGISGCKKLTLCPGDVLFLPPKWWHYVENLETAISINAWIPLASDDEDRLNESLVQILIKQLTESVSKKNKQLLINPHTTELLNSTNFEDVLDMANIHKKEVQSIRKNKKLKQESCCKSENSDNFSIEDVLNKYSFIENIDTLSHEEFNSFLKNQNKNKENLQEAYVEENIDYLVDFINSVTHPDVVSLIKEKFV